MTDTIKYNDIHNVDILVFTNGMTECSPPMALLDSVWGKMW